MEGGPEERGGSIGGGRGSSAAAAAARERSGERESGGAREKREQSERERRREGEEGAERRLNGPQTYRPTNRAVPVLVPRAASPAQARPGAWHGHDTSLNGHRPGRSRVVLSRAVSVLAQRVRPSWPPIRQGVDIVSRAVHPLGQFLPSDGRCAGEIGRLSQLESHGVLILLVRQSGAGAGRRHGGGPRPGEACCGRRRIPSPRPAGGGR